MLWQNKSPKCKYNANMQTLRQEKSNIWRVPTASTSQLITKLQMLHARVR